MYYNSALKEDLKEIIANYSFLKGFFSNLDCVLQILQVMVFHTILAISSDMVYVYRNAIVLF